LTFNSTKIAGSQGGPYSESIWVWDIEHCKTVTEMLSTPIVAKKPLWGAYGGKPIYFIDDNHLIAGGAGMCIYDIRSGEEFMVKETNDDPYSRKIMCANYRYIAAQAALDRISK
jgi:hypothetical protein